MKTTNVLRYGVELLEAGYSLEYALLSMIAVLRNNYKELKMVVRRKIRKMCK